MDVDGSWTHTTDPRRTESYRVAGASELQRRHTIHSGITLRLSVVAADGSVRWQGEGAGEVVLAWRGAYDPGDSLVLETDTSYDLWLVVKLDACLERSVVLLRGGRFVFPIPFGDEQKPYGKGRAFEGERHWGFARVADPREVGSWRNLALNAMDRKLAACEPEAGSVPVLYPHASTNVVCDNPQFSPRNAIDGVVSPGRHGSWPHGSWGVNDQDDAWLRVDFGAPVVADELRVYLRADFPHDSCWREATVEFSDGGRQRLELVKSGARQSFALGGRRIEWLRLCDLQRREEPGFCALSQLEVWGQVKMAQNSGGVVCHLGGESNA